MNFIINIKLNNTRVNPNIQPMANKQQVEKFELPLKLMTEKRTLS